MFDTRIRFQGKPEDIKHINSPTGNRPREKTFIVEREEDPLMCLLDHLLYLAVYDDVLVSPRLRTVDNVSGTYRTASEEFAAVEDQTRGIRFSRIQGAQPHRR
ncbi:hypothetical protein MMC11_004741 [Xylographa trunciseda]|nr:hypothetical protein [Xylographa trunciseda]